MNGAGTIALSIFAAYFFAILALFFLIFKSLSHSYTANNDPSRSQRAILFVLLAAGSFAHTWYYMFRFMEWSFKDYELKFEASDKDFLKRLSNWLINTALFEQAWFTVCSGPLRWWLSEQLCSYTVGAWTIFVFVEGKRRSIKHIWAYMLLGQLVAISVASNLFYVALSLSATRSAQKVTHASPVLWSSTLLSLLTVSFTPSTAERTFLPNLLVMHSLLMVPLLFGPWLSTSSTTRLSLSLRSLHLLVFLKTASMHIRASIVAFSSLEDEHFFGAVWSTLFSHPAQSSIGWDVIWTSISFVVWTCLSDEASLKRRIASPLLTALGSVGIVAPALAMLDDETQQAKYSFKAD